MAWEHKDDQCPLASVDRRLSDLHRFWHQADDAYFKPDDFRLAIQAAIQTARQVSFVIQKNKDLIPEFDNWYAGQQAVMRSIPLMKWMIDARNRIEKQGDLDGHSFINAEVVYSHLEDGPSIQVPANLADTPLVLLNNIPMSLLGDHIKRNGILRIRRRWIDNTLPEIELLEAVATAYGHLANLVHSAHEQIGLSESNCNYNDSVCANNINKKGSDRLPCMIGHEDSRTSNIWIATSSAVETETFLKEIGFDEIIQSESRVRERYGLDPSDMYAKSNDIHDQLRSIFRFTRAIFERDGGHITMVIFFKDGNRIDFRELNMNENANNFLMMRDLAIHAARISADGLIFISETWGGEVNSTNPFMRPVDSPTRLEFLTATSVSKSSNPLMLSAEILRYGKKVSLTETSEQTTGAYFAFAPLYKVWGKEIPYHWNDVETGSDGGINGRG